MPGGRRATRCREYHIPRNHHFFYFFALFFRRRVCDLVLDAAEAELVLFLAGPGSADKQEQQQGAAPVPVWLELMSMFSNDAPMLVGNRRETCLRAPAAGAAFVAAFLSLSLSSLSPFPLLPPLWHSFLS